MRKKKREITFKTSLSQTHEEINDNENSDEEMALFTRKFYMILKNG